MRLLLRFILIASVLTISLVNPFVYAQQRENQDQSQWQVQRQIINDSIDQWFLDTYWLASNQYEIIPERLLEADFRSQITREEFCEIVILAEKKLVGRVPGELQNAFSDSGNDAINTAAFLGYVSGYADGTFQPEKSITRQEIFKIIYGFMMKHDEQELDIASSLVLNQFQDEELLAEWSQLPTAFVSYRGIVQGNTEMKLNPLGNTTKAEAVVLMTRVVQNLMESVYQPMEDEGWEYYNEQNSSATHPLFQVGFNLEKYTYVLGEKERYQSAEEALLDMTKISVPTWTLLESGEKRESSKTIIVHKNIAEVVLQIFLEIFEGEEKFPIKDVGGFSWRSNENSEHRLGLAIDINANENYMIKGEQILAGSLWEPGVNPYSITPEGEVVRIFNKYGFAWGGNAWQSNQDYMHFSYFGN